MEGLAENSKSIYEVCDSKTEKSAPMYYAPLHYGEFVGIMGWNNFAEEPWFGKSDRASTLV